ncbi:MAG: hypothetical protein Fur009_3410 [Candidatus Microgenomates bacterium]
MNYKINLLQDKEKPFLEKVVFFGLNYLRYIIVITQLIVIIVFFYRFQLDQQVIDLREEVDQKKEIIQIVLPLLNETARIDKKTKEIEKILANQSKFKAMLSYIFSLIPESMKLTNVEVKGNGLDILGYVSDPAQFQSFFNILKKDQKFKNVELKSIKKTETGYIFQISLKNFL